MSDRIALLDLDADLEVAGKRFVELESKIISVAKVPDNITGIQVQADSRFRRVKEIRISWLKPEESSDYELTNKTRIYMCFNFGIPEATKQEYNKAWLLFQRDGVERLCSVLGYSTWGFGKWIGDKRGQDIFIVEFDGAGCPMWDIYLTVLPEHTYLDCLALAERLDHFVDSDLLPSIRRAV